MRKFIINEAFGIIALVVLLIPQVAHTVFVFEVNSHYDNPWFGCVMPLVSTWLF